MSGGGGNTNAVFYADAYHPIQSGSIDGTDILPHDNAVYRALLCSAAGLYDPFRDPKVTGDPYCTVFVGRLSRHTGEETLRKAMSKYGRVKNLRLVRDIVTGASRGYAFVEYETEKEMRCAYEDAHHSIIDENEVIIDYNRQQLMPGWIPRRLGGGLGGQKESGQLRFGGRERPFRAPHNTEQHPIPYDELRRLGIPPPPEGRYLSRFQIPSPPRRSRSHGREYSPLGQREDSSTRKRRSEDREDRYLRRRSSVDRKESSHRNLRNREYSLREDPPAGKILEDREEPHRRQGRSSVDRVNPLPAHHMNKEYSQREESSSRKRPKDREEQRRSTDRDSSSHKNQRHYSEHSYDHKRSTSREYGL